VAIPVTSLGEGNTYTSHYTIRHIAGFFILVIYREELILCKFILLYRVDTKFTEIAKIVQENTWGHAKIGQLCELDRVYIPNQIEQQQKNGQQIS
jgi:hypothetical protein